MKIFLTGASGLVGSAFARAAAERGHEVVGVVGQFEGALPGVARRLALDLGYETIVTMAVLDERPGAIVHCAAVSEPSACVADPERSERLNVDLPATLARLARHLGARFVHVSSEQVFDGARRTPYAIADAPAPINLYGRQKLAAEQAVRAAAPAQSAIVRAPLLMGDSPGGRRAQHERLLADWATGKPARLYTDEFRQPCTAANLADVLLELVEREELRGIFHWAGAELVSRFDLGCRVRQHFGLAERVSPIVAVTRAETPEISPQRQPCLGLDLAPLAGKIATKPQTIAEQLATLHVPGAVAAWFAEARRESSLAARPG